MRYNVSSLLKASIGAQMTLTVEEERRSLGSDLTVEYLRGRIRLTRTDRRNPWGGEYGWWWFSHTELRDEKAVLFATYLPRGTYEYTYLIRASMPGEFRVIPTNAYEMYFPEVFGRSDGGVFNITQ